jgi:hypothetical protein
MRVLGAYRTVVALVAGIIVTQAGLHGTALVYSAAVAGLAGIAASTFAFGGRSRTAAPQLAQPAAAADLPPGPCTVPPYVPAAHAQAEPAKALR